MIDHAKNPRNFGIIKDSDYKTVVINRHCGDEISLYLKISKNKIENIQFAGSGCAVAISSASMLTEYLNGKNVDLLKKLKREDVLKNFGVSLTPSREKCALLVFEGVKKLDEELISNN